MANNYRQASFVVEDLTAAEEKWLRAELGRLDEQIRKRKHERSGGGGTVLGIADGVAAGEDQ